MRKSHLLRLSVFVSLIVGLFLLLGSGALAAPPTDGPPGLERAKQVQEANTPDLMAMPGVVGTAVSVDDSGNPVIRIFVESENVSNMPSSMQGIPVQTVVTGIIWARDTTAKYRPSPIGVSVGHPDITAGTIGARVIDNQGNVFILSNNHVLANSNDANIGDSALQPGAFDGGSDPADAIGTLYDYYEIIFGSGSSNTMDAAIALVDDADLSGSTLPGGYGSPGNQIVNPSVGQSVQKCGRTTGCTTGTVEEVNVTVSVCFGGVIFCTKSATFVNQFTITPGDFSAGGDSGSLIVSNDGNNNPVGLLFAGSSTRTIANPIGVVLNHFGVTIDGGDAGDPGPDPTPTPEPDPDPTPTPDPDPGDIQLSANGYKVRGVNHVDLSWSGAGGTQVDIYLNGSLLTTTSNSGSFTHNTGDRGGATYSYQVCEAGSSTCSAVVNVDF
jgi:hypothetical protein